MNLEDVRKSCFFCGKEIEKNKTLEHIIPNGLLKKLKIKEEVLNGNLNIQYSRIKVPAHQHCNNTFGSQYEELLLDLLDDPERIYNSIATDNGIAIQYSPEFNDTSIIRTWMTKIYYGLFYNDFLKTTDDHYREVCQKLIESKNFELTRESYQNNYGFNLPSSLYVFKTKNTEFDLRTIEDPATIMLRINGLILILCIGDGFLCKQYLYGESLKWLNEYLSLNENSIPEFPSSQVALAEIIALRINIPKSPSFMFTSTTMINLSLNTMAADPDTLYQVDLDQIVKDRDKFLLDFGIKLEERN